jgi:hypothetical protein
LPTADVAQRSNSFRVRRNSTVVQQQQQQQQLQQPRSVNNFPSTTISMAHNNTAGSVENVDFCKHKLYCCLNQQQPSFQVTIPSDLANEPKFTSTKSPSSSIMQLKFNEITANYSDDEKNSMSMRYHRKHSADDANYIRNSNSNHFHNKSSSQHQLMRNLSSNYDGYRWRDEDKDCGKFWWFTLLE